MDPSIDRIRIEVAIWSVISVVSGPVSSSGGQARPPVMGGPRQETEADGNEGPDDLSVEQDQEPQDSPDIPVRMDEDVGFCS